MAVNQANIKAVITAEDKASAVVKGFGDNVSNSNKNITSSVSGSMVAIGLATAGIVAFGKKSLDAYNEQDLATVRLQAGINNVSSAVNKNITGLLNQATALQKTTRFSDEAYISAQGILSTFQLNTSAISKLTPRLADMSEGLARVSGGMPDLEGNAILVAKAIGGEDTAGLSGALRKAGVMMTKTQAELLKTGTVEQRVALVTEVLDNNFKGLAETAGKTTAGRIAQLKNAFNELMEQVGSVIATAITPLLKLLLKYPAILTGLSVSVGILVTAFVGLKVISIATTAIQAFTVATRIALGAIGPVGWAILAVSAAITVAVMLYNKFHKSNQDVATATVATTTATEQLNEEMRRLAISQDAAKQTTDALKTSQYDLEGSSLNLEQAQLAYNNATAEYGPKSLEAREAAHRLEGAKKDLADATEKVNVAQKNVNQSEGLYALNTPVAVNAIALRTGAINGMTLNIGAAQAGIVLLDATISSKVPILQGSVQVLQGSVQKLQGSVQTLQSTSITLQGGGGTRLQGSRAHGGPVNAGGAYLVGENGPEVVVPNQASTVIPNGGGSSGGSININMSGIFTGSDIEARKLANMILGHLRDTAGSKNMSLRQMIG